METAKGQEFSAEGFTDPHIMVFPAPLLGTSNSPVLSATGTNDQLIELSETNSQLTTHLICEGLKTLSEDLFASESPDTSYRYLMDSLLYETSPTSESTDNLNVDNDAKSPERVENSCGPRGLINHTLADIELKQSLLIHTEQNPPLDRSETHEVPEKLSGHLEAQQESPFPSMNSPEQTSRINEKQNSQQDATPSKRRKRQSETLHQCSECSKSFKQLGHLRNHHRVHTGERPYACEFCGKSFAQSGHLTSHVNAHTSTKNYACKYCEKKFSQSGHLRNHERLHSGERPFQCKMCDKTFVQSGHLVSHLRIHENVKPYSCPVCGKGFTQSGHVKSHLKVHKTGLGEDHQGQRSS
ncbi:zinc finger protein 32-like [Varroa jacobsoni]|uniref:zinc finger protein 32-like n=1 Tax=Varroa jacobsoni TaxID=62625 RepID=UPI000BFAAFE3|nr:zinc finger protein 32-like [Varroa jacobsoni]